MQGEQVFSPFLVWQHTCLSCPGVGERDSYAGVTLQRIPWGSPENPPSLCSNSRGIHRGSAGDLLLLQCDTRIKFPSCVVGKYYYTISLSRPFVVYDKRSGGGGVSCQVEQDLDAEAAALFPSDAISGAEREREGEKQLFGSVF